MARTRVQKTIFTGVDSVAPAVGAVCSIYEADTTNLVAIYSSREGGVVISNPFTTDADGKLAFYVESGRYDLDIGHSSGAQQYPDFLGVNELIISGPAGGLMFDDVAAMVSETPVNSDQIDPADFVGQKVLTVVNNQASKAGGAEYIVKTAAQAALDGDVIDGYANHSFNSSDYVAVLSNFVIHSLYVFGYVGDSSPADALAQQAATAYTRNNSNEATSCRYVGNIVVGADDLPNTSAPRDAFQVARTINGKTDCHGFADKTVVEDASNSGTYGVFDGTVVYEGSKAYNHLFCFQDRTEYNGTGSLGSWGNIIWPVKNGGGSCARTDIEIKDVGGSGGTITSHIGLFIQNLSRASSNVGINLAQNNGFSLLATGADAEFRVAGIARFTQSLTAGNVQPESGIPLNWSRAAAGDFKGFCSSNTLGVTAGAIGDGNYSVVTNGGNRLIVQDSSGGYAVTAGISGAQNLGSASVRWAEVFAVNGTINTSDERLKDFFDIDSAEKAAALEIKSVIRKFKWKDSVEKNGDSARFHFGVGAQSCVSIMESHGLDPDKYSFICYDEWEEGGESVNSYAIRYSELAMFILSAI